MTNTTVVPDLLKPDQAAAMLSVSRSMIYRLMRTGELQSVKVGNCRRIPRKAVAEYIEYLTGWWPKDEDDSA